MGGGSTPHACALCGSQLRAESRFCRVCGQSVLSNGTGPIPFPKLPAVAPGPRHGTPRPAATVRDSTVRDSAVREGTVREDAIREATALQDAGAASEAWAMPLRLAGEDVAPPAWSHEDTLTSLAIPAIPADWQALRYRPATRQADYQSAGYQLPGYPSQGDQPPGHQPPADGGGSWRRRIIVGVLAVIVAVGGSAAGLLIARAHASSGQAAGPRNSTSAQNSGSPGPVSPDSVSRGSASASAEQQGADDLAALLSQSVADRGTIRRAYHDVRSCGPRLAHDRATFQQAVAARQDLLGRLVSLPDAAALPAGTISSLTRAWQASISADRDFAAWAQNESATCRPNGSDASLSAAIGLGHQASRDKAAFVGRWNPIARQYRLPAYSWVQL
jgi:hypothetical protein